MYNQFLELCGWEDCLQRYVQEMYSTPCVWSLQGKLGEVGREGGRWEGKEEDGKGRRKMGREGGWWEGKEEDGKGRRKVGREGGRWEEKEE